MTITYGHNIIRGGNFPELRKICKELENILVQLLKNISVFRILQIATD